MSNLLRFYINGAWVEPAAPRRLAVVDPATEEAFAEISVGSAADVDRAVAAARRAFPAFSTTTIDERLALLDRIVAAYRRRIDELADAVSREMGAPLRFALEEQAESGAAHLETARAVLSEMDFETRRGTTLIVREPIGVAGMITPWNWPLNQIACKVAPALAAGCTMVLKPSEIAPLSGILFAEILDEAGVPAGVFNLVNGDGPSVGQAISAHPGIDMVSFTGSTRAGVLVAREAAATVKRVAQELGGKSANIILDDADLEAAVTAGVSGCFGNSGQSCDAPTRMLVPRALMDQALAIAKRATEAAATGDPRDGGTDLGPVVSDVQFDKIQGLIEAGIAEGATLVTGGPGRPAGLSRGFYVRPTVFGHVTPEMTIAREEVFGPVLAVMAYDSEAEAVQIANALPYGLAAYVQSGDPERAQRIARQMRAGQVNINSPDWDITAPFGGYKQSGNGREYGIWGVHDYLETKALIGYGAD